MGNIPDTKGSTEIRPRTRGAKDDRTKLEEGIKDAGGI